MGKVLSVVPRHVKSKFNIENRAEKVISKEKPTPAPKYPGNIKDLEWIKKEHPEVMEEQSKRDMALDDRLKEVYVISKDPMPVVVPPDKIKSVSENPDRPLPMNRENVQLPASGFVEPMNITQGKVTLRQAMKFIADHQSDPKTWTVDRISNEYLLNKEATDNILKHFRSFELYIPEPVKGGKKTMFGRPEPQKRNKIENETPDKKEIEG